MSTTMGPLTDYDAYVTSFLPLTTAYPSVAGCESAFSASIQSNSTYLVAFQPANVTVSSSRSKCLPPVATQWWLQGDYYSTYYRVAPIVCPAAYKTVWTSTYSSSTLTVACCPSGYTFQGLYGYGYLGECGSLVPSGRSFTYTRDMADGSASTGVVTMASATTVYAVPVNGFVPIQTSTSATAGQSSSSPAATSPVAAKSEGMSDGTKIGIGVGVALGSLLIISLCVAAFLLGRHRRHRRQQPRFMQEIYPESEGK